MIWGLPSLGVDVSRALECLVLMAQFSLVWALLDSKAFIAGKPGALLRLNLTGACRKEVTFHI